MMDEQGTQSGALLEDVKRALGVLADSAAAQAEHARATDQRLERIDAKLGELTFGVNSLQTAVGRIETRVESLETKVDRLEVFAADAGPRIERIEAHLALPRPLPRRELAQPRPSKHHRRKPTKPT